MAERLVANRVRSLPPLLEPVAATVSLTAPLPALLTEFVERPRELAALRALCDEEGVRLITLAGPAGCGKTRLALRLAGDLERTFRAGVVFVPLTPVHQPELVPGAIAEALGLRGERPTGAALADALCSRSLLLVLDNLEHLLAAAPLIAELLTASPHLTVLATSRSPLRLSGEHVFAVPAMAVPGDDDDVTAANADQFDALRLFATRARAVKREFQWTDERAQTVASVCRRLDGLPLAIELAAARSAALSPRELLANLDRRLPLLTDGPRDAPDRLRSMAGAIAWSYDLLTYDEQCLFRRLASFGGGCTLAAARTVARAADDLTLLHTLAALVASSLVRLEEGADGESRYLMLETIREFGLERLAENGAAGGAAAQPGHVDTAAGAPSWSLTRREHEVLGLLVEGQSNRAIADSLSLSERTVENHVSHIMAKLEVDSRTAAATFAIRHTLIERVMSE